MQKLNKALSTGAVLTASVSPILAQTYNSSNTGEAESAVAGGITLLIICCVFIFVIGYIALKIYLTLDALKRDYGDNTNGKVLGLALIWLVDLIIAPLGPILYYFLIMKKYPKMQEGSSIVQES